MGTMTDNQDHYLCFCVDSVYYIVPVMDVEKICLLRDTREDQELIWLHLGETDGHRKNLHSCVVILREEQTRFGVIADLVEGIVQIMPDDQFEIPRVLRPQYPWLLGTAVRRREKRLLLLLNGQGLGLLSDGETGDGFR